MKTPIATREIYSDTYKDIYFCEEDGLAEGDHVFLKGNRLPERWLNRDEFVIAETGFGTGLNFLATWLKWEETSKLGQHLTYISFEKFPLTPEQIRTALSRWHNEVGDKLETILADYPVRITGWHPIRINDAISLILVFDDVNIALPELSAKVDAWFLDGFAPAKNPEMWSEIVFNSIAKNSANGATIASFTAAGLVKRGLREVGFEIAKSRGFGRKRDMIYGRFLQGVENRPKPKTEDVAVIGGGLAGCHVAHRLRLENITVDLYEENDIASGASGNVRGLFNPRFTALRNAVSDFYASGYALVLRQFKKYPDIDLKRCGSLHLLTDEDKARRLKSTVDTWQWHKDHMRLVTAQEASDIAGVSINTECLFLPDAGHVSPQKFCRTISSNAIKEKITSILRQGEKWIINGSAYDVVIFACGADINNFEQTSALPISTVRGQVGLAPATEKTKKVKTNICYGGYFSPAENGEHIIGSTFQPWLTDTQVRPEDNDDIIANFEKHVPALLDEIKITDARFSLRTAARDRFPVIGKLNDYDNLYISAAHGSHGLISAAMAAEIITAQILARTVPVPKSVMAALYPQRFTKK